MLDEQLSPESTATSLKASLKSRSAQLPKLPKAPTRAAATSRSQYYPATIDLDAEMEIEMGPRTPLRRSWMTKVPIVASLHRYFTTPRAHKPSGTRPAGSRVLRRLAQRTPIVPQPTPIVSFPLEVDLTSHLAQVDSVSAQPIEASQSERTNKSFTHPKSKKPGGTRPGGNR